jgi:hypothetical protein
MENLPKYPIHPIAAIMKEASIFRYKALRENSHKQPPNSPFLRGCNDAMHHSDRIKPLYDKDDFTTEEQKEYEAAFHHDRHIKMYKRLGYVIYWRIKPTTKWFPDFSSASECSDDSDSCDGDNGDTFTGREEFDDAREFDEWGRFD